MRLWRLDSAEFAPAALKGEGAKLYGGRWNTVGTPMVYLSTTLSSAAMEKFVNLPRLARHQGLQALCFTVPDELIETCTVPRPLPAGWRSLGDSPAAQRWGAAWCASMASVAARVPSLLLPLDLYEGRIEHNVILNPLHEAITRVSLEMQLPFSFDPRVWKD